MDSFETSTHFAQMLRGLVPQMPLSLRAAHFALKNSDSEDYLFQAILEILRDQRVELNTRSTIFQFIDVLMHESFYISQQANSHYNYPYVHRLKTALPKIVLLVLAENGCNLFNVYNNLRNISKTLQVDVSKFAAQYADADSLITEKDREGIKKNVPFEFSPETDDDPVTLAWLYLVCKRRQSHYERLRMLEHLPPKSPVSEEELFNVRRDRRLLTKKQILARMEDDRETHKKSKETLWVVDRVADTPAVAEEEFLEYYWSRVEPLLKKGHGEFLLAFDELNRLAEASYKDPVA